MKSILFALPLLMLQAALADDRSYEVAQGQTLQIELLQKSLQGELQMICNAELDTSSTCKISSFQIVGMRPFYNVQSRRPSAADKMNMHIIDIQLNSQLVRCNVEFSNENRTIDLKECESSSLKAKLFEQIISVGYKQAGLAG